MKLVASLFLGVRTITLLTALSVSSGCLYLHDDVRQKTAREAKDQFERIAAQSTANAEIASQTKHVGQVLAVLRDLNTETNEIALNALLDKRWDDVLQTVPTQLGHFKGQRDAEVVAQAERKTRLAESLSQQVSASNKTSDLLKAINQAAQQRASYEATQYLLRESLLMFVGSQQSSSIDALKAVLDKEITFEQYKADAEERLVPEEKPAKKTVGDLVGLPSAALSLVDADKPEDIAIILLRLKNVAPKQFAKGLTIKDPGISTTLIGLAYDIARAEERRIKVEIDETRRELALVDAYTAALKKEVARLENHVAATAVGLTRVATLRKSGEARIRDTAHRLAAEFQRSHLALIGAAPDKIEERTKAKIEARGNLHVMLFALASFYYASVVQAAEIDSLKTQIEFVDAHRQLRLAAVILEEREAVIRRGLEGLVAFHDSGISREDIRTLIDIAQMAGIFAIAGK